MSPKAMASSLNAELKEKGFKANVKKVGEEGLQTLIVLKEKPCVNEAVFWLGRFTKAPIKPKIALESYTSIFDLTY
jgi:N-acetylglutamate synthase/N-acetylornithine aminotransferase